MRDVLLQRAIKLNRSHKRRKWWQSAVRTMAMFVVFCTTYALILPAITMEQETLCGKEAHSHEESCYVLQPVSVLNCCLEEDSTMIHSHGQLCYDGQGNLICQLPELLEHSHGEGCYGLSQEPICGYVHEHGPECTVTQNVLICGMEEAEAHEHSEACTSERALICGLEESSGHTHGDGCGTTETVLICTPEDPENHTHEDACYQTTEVPCQIPEEAGHTHSDSCYEIREIPCTAETVPAHIHEDACYEAQEVPCSEPTTEEHVHEDGCYEKLLICELAQVAAHTHEEACYDAEQNLICQLPEILVHDHTELCLAETEQTQAFLVCELEEHVHSEECYPEEEEANTDGFLCGYGVHQHVETCYNEAGELVCTIPEHSHEAACILADLDLTADVETKEQWMASFESVTLTGNWPEDVLNVARSQLDYQESTKNVILAGEQLKGYTRYGAWYGDPYADWNTMFAAFTLHYAGVRDFPVEADAAVWAGMLAEAQLYQTADAYTPKAGDIAFLVSDPGQEEAAPDRVAIVAELIPDTEEAPATLKLISGDEGDKVKYLTLELADPSLAGYAEMPAGYFTEKTFTGHDFEITVTYGRNAAIPRNAELVVHEIPFDSDAYQMYYRQSLEALKNDAERNAEGNLQVSFARFFDIGFAVDGAEMEPAAPVDVRIRYSESIPVHDNEEGLVVHFAATGIEILHADIFTTEEMPAVEDDVAAAKTLATMDETELVDIFLFTQGSFSVSGTLMATRAPTTATKVQPYEIDNTGNKLYVLYAQINNSYYAIDGNGKPVQVTVNGNNVTLPGSNAANLMWSFVDKPNDDGHYLYRPVKNEGTGRYLHPYNNSSGRGVTTDGPWDLHLVVSNDSFQIQGDDSHRIVMTEWDANPQRINNATVFYAAVVDSYNGTYNVWFDGTVGGMMSYYGAANRNIPAEYGADGTAVVELPETWDSSTKYDYTLRGWYDIHNRKYYRVNPNDDAPTTATISGNTVFYADWIAATYDVGQDNSHVVDSVDTNDFITTYVFDYNALFNVMSQYMTNSQVTATGHSETWAIYNNGERVPYNNEKSLGFAFVDYDANGEFSYANNRDNTNTNQSGITSGILTEVRNNSGKDLLDLLFNPETDVIGKYYAGTGNYLFQYMDSTTANYDGEHDGYYYLDSRLNAASYNQSAQRFYLYDYLERTSDSAKDGGAGQYSDLLPFNSPYIFEEHQVDAYTDPIRRPGYEYDAKDGGNNHPEYNALDDANTNYFFGLRTDIEFFLPNTIDHAKGVYVDEYGNYGNISTRGEHMVFEFHGDDDVWVFVDGELMLDIGGLHGIKHGRIDFSTGTISYGENGEDGTTQFNISEGTHHMTVYYMERGSSQSNCAIYFNIAPRYDLEITKEDIVTAEKLDGAVFSIFDDEAMTKPSELWTSYEAHRAGAESTNTFAVVDGVAKCWGISAGKTYYIYETSPPYGYPDSDDMIRITLNNRGTATIETTTLHGKNEIATEGFAVINQEINDTLKIVALTVTNQKRGDTTEVRVEKTWDENSTSLPQYITVYLTADGERVGRSARLTEGNGWSYTWTGLPKYRADGIDQEIEYVVEEVFVPNYITVQGDSIKVENYVDWVRVDQMSDSKTFLLVHNGNALTYNGSFGWMSRSQAEQEESLSAQWNVTTDHDGFHLKNGLGYTLTYSSRGFYGINDDASSLNQVFYFLNSRLVVHDHDVYYQFGNNGAVVLEDGLAFQLYQKETLTGLLTNIVNKPVDEEKQTYVEVSKIWEDGAENHAAESVVIHLYADGKDTGRYLVLNAANNWQGSFDDLPYYQDGTTTQILYTVVEDVEGNYLPSYSEPNILQGRPVSFWQNVNSLEAGTEAYRISSNGYSLTVASDNDPTAVPNDVDDTRQQWKVVNRYGTLILQNVGTNRYLNVNSGDLTTTSDVSYASAVTMNDGYIMVGGAYLELGSGYAGVTNNSANIDKTALRVTRWVTSTGMNGTGYTVTNYTNFYQLPNTGGSGTYFFTFGGLLCLMAAALMYATQFGRKRQRGGRCRN